MSDTASKKRDYMTFAQAARLLPKPPAPVTLWRWATKGIKAPDGSIVRLRYVRMGGSALTTPEWLDHFGDMLAKAHEEHIADDHVLIPTKAEARTILYENGLL